MADPEPEYLTARDLDKILDHRLAKFKREIKSEIMRETVDLIQQAVAAQSLRETQLEITKLTKDIVTPLTLDFLEPDAALALATALENDLSHLGDQLFLPCIDQGFGSEACADRAAAGTPVMLQSLMSVHVALFAGMLGFLAKKLEQLKDHLFVAADPRLEPLADQTLVDVFHRAGCPNPNPSSALLDALKMSPTESDLLQLIDSYCHADATSPSLVQDCCGFGQTACQRTCESPKLRLEVSYALEVISEAVFQHPRQVHLQAAGQGQGRQGRVLPHPRACRW
ncbi:unnamed protein product [Symbiodinium pilosum]|uniref:Uncharacterized protein n=1 Tax=Symbiodinium pilosum TaxID=2952 RepID=A0A812YQL7_SYMPI|nr:unnamed protein product [Symbiodinium pilosum]